MTGGRKAGLVVLWLLALVLIAFGVSHALVVGNDLRSFMPPAQTADQRLLLDQIGEGPAARLLLLAISAPTPESSVALSQELAAALRGDARFSEVLNGDADLSTLDSGSGAEIASSSRRAAGPSPIWSSSRRWSAVCAGGMKLRKSLPTTSERLTPKASTASATSQSATRPALRVPVMASGDGTVFRVRCASADRAGLRQRAGRAA